jgi:hypothetical protein
LPRPHEEDLAVAAGSEEAHHLGPI